MGSFGQGSKGSQSSQDSWQSELRARLDANSRGYFCFLATSRWLGVRLDLLVALFLLLTIAISLTSLTWGSDWGSDEVSEDGEGRKEHAGKLGLAVTYALSLGAVFQWMVRCSAEVENVMISVERVLAYGSLESECRVSHAPRIDTSSSKSSTHWPQLGELQFRNLRCRYRDDLPLVLKGISCTINARERIGICGRTGAGKSTLLQVLFRLVEPVAGQDGYDGVYIDGINTAEVDLLHLRKSISAIPQTPILFAASLRQNLDPFDEYADEEVRASLQQVLLDVDLPGMLDQPVLEGSFSLGQRQQLCLARALLPKNKILLLDEATASVDHQIDQNIQLVLRTHFSHATVLIIAHRLSSIMSTDRVLLLDQGVLSAFGPPEVVLKQKQEVDLVTL